MTIRKITNRAKIRNYVINLGDKPFTSKDVAIDTNINKITIMNELRLLEKKGIIKTIDRDRSGKYYIKVSRRYINKRQNEQYDWYPKRNILEKIITILEGNEKTSKEIAKEANISESSSIRYLTVMIAMGIVVKKGRKYLLTSKELPKIILSFDEYRRIYSDKKKIIKIRKRLIKTIDNIRQQKEIEEQYTQLKEEGEKWKQILR